MDHSALTHLFPRSRVRWAAAALIGASLLSGCAHKHAQQAAAPADKAATSGGFMTGMSTDDAGPSKFVVAKPDSANPEVPAPMETGPAPKFVAPKVTGQGAPSLASVPDKAPTPPSTRQEREKTIEGLIGDRERAHYTDNGGRTMPVAVRPLSEAQAKIDDEPAAPPKPQAAKTGTVTRLGNQPAPGKQEAPAATPDAASGEAAKASVAAAAQVAETAIPPVRPDMEGPRPSAMPTARSDGFQTLANYAATTSVSNQVASVDFSGTGNAVSTVGRRALSDAVKQGEHSKGAFRVIGRAAEPSALVQERATAVARELQRLGVTPDRIYVGTDTGQDGRVDVVLDQ